jgi:hypothetical protein
MYRRATRRTSAAVTAMIRRTESSNQVKGTEFMTCSK